MRNVLQINSQRVRDSRVLSHRTRILKSKEARWKLRGWSRRSPLQGFRNQEWESGIGQRARRPGRKRRDLGQVGTQDRAIRRKQTHGTDRQHANVVPLQASDDATCMSDAFRIPIGQSRSIREKVGPTATHYAAKRRIIWPRFSVRKTADDGEILQKQPFSYLRPETKEVLRRKIVMAIILLE